MVRPPARVGRFVDELYRLGVLSLIIICLCGTAVGAVIGLQGYNTLIRFGAAEGRRSLHRQQPRTQQRGDC